MARKPMKMMKEVGNSDITIAQSCHTAGKASGPDSKTLLIKAVIVK